jgi:hypothetical protein
MVLADFMDMDNSVSEDKAAAVMVVDSNRAINMCHMVVDEGIGDGGQAGCACVIHMSRDCSVHFLSNLLDGSTLSMTTCHFSHYFYLYSSSPMDDPAHCSLSPSP